MQNSGCGGGGEFRLEVGVGEEDEIEVLFWILLWQLADRLGGRGKHLSAAKQRGSYGKRECILYKRSSEQAASQKGVD
jgi:hypothetical protein